MSSEITCFSIYAFMMCWLLNKSSSHSSIHCCLMFVKLEDGQFKLQSRLEEEEEAKAALLSRIQRLTKLILVSTKSSQSSRFSHRLGPRRRHSFGEEEVHFLPFLLLSSLNVSTLLFAYQSIRYLSISELA